MSLLIIEDDQALLKLLEALMRRGNIGIETLSRGAGALNAIKSEKHDAVILDLMLPDVSGFEILRSLQATRPDLLSRIIVLTAASEVTLAELSPARSSIWKLVRKPFDITELIEAARSCIAYHAGRNLPAPKELSAWFRERCEASGARGGVIAVRGSAEHLEVQAACGLSRALIDRHFPLKCDQMYPICFAARSGDPVWVSSYANAGFPLLPIWTANHARSMATVPLRSNDLVTGAIGFTFNESQPFDPQQRRPLLAIASEAFMMVRPKLA